MAKIDTLFMTKTAENYTLWGRTYPMYCMHTLLNLLMTRGAQAQNRDQVTSSEDIDSSLKYRCLWTCSIDISRCELGIDSF